jgi:hypothetical protein
MSQPLIQLRAYQAESFRSKLGIFCRVWRRQSGKSYVLGAEGLDLMMSEPCNVIFASAALRLGQENILKEAEIWRDMIAMMRKAAVAGKFRLTTTADDDQGKTLDVDALADLLDHTRLEVKLWHSRTSFSRSIVVAPNPDTAVGWTGHVFLDEVGRIPDFQDVYEAMEPIVSSQDKFVVRMATTPPPDDTHYSYELLAPPAGEDFPVNPKGNWYKSEAGIMVHRVGAADGHAAGVPLRDLETRQKITPAESRARAIDKTAWDRNFDVAFLTGVSTTAITGTAIAHAQAMADGVGVKITETLTLANMRDLVPADWVDKLTPSRKIAVGHDVATSEGGSANPASLVVSQDLGAMKPERLVLAWKTEDPALATDLIRMVLEDIRRAGHTGVLMAVDASNEVYHARNLKSQLAHLAQIVLIKGGQKLKFGAEEMDSKTLLGNLYANAVNDGTVPMPSGKWIAEDRRLVKKKGGRFYADLGKDGEHGDTFDAGKLAHWRLIGKGGGSASGITAMQVGGTTTKQKVAGKLAGMMRRMGLGDGNPTTKLSG